MKIIDKDTFEYIHRQMENKARDIDLAMFNVIFQDMDKEVIGDALSMYQNEDGGFGHGLEADNLNPYSTSLQTLEALNILRSAGFTSIYENDFVGTMIRKAFDYLFHLAPKQGHHWLFSDPTNNQFPCAIWHRNQKDDVYSKNNPTALILAHAFYFLDVKMKNYKKAIAILELVLQDFQKCEEFDKHEIICYKMLFETLREKKISCENLEAYEQKIFTKSVEIVCKNKSEFINPYPNMPLDLFDRYTLDSAMNQLIDENLDFLIDSLPKHGLWEPNWKWYSEYPEEESALLKWMGCITYRNLNLLKRFNRLKIN